MAQKRRHTRYEMIEMVNIINTDTGISIRGCLEDISVGGASFVSTSNLVGWKHISVELPGMNVKGEIVRSEMKAGNWINRVKFDIGFLDRVKLKSVIKKAVNK